MNAYFWIQYFQKHRHQQATEIYAWYLPPPDAGRPEIAALAGSLAIFQLGESGGGSRLLGYAAAHARRDPGFAGYVEAVKWFVDEEHVHAGLLRRMVLRLGGTLLEKQWSNSLFRWLRGALGLEFNIQILLSAELIARGYYGLLSRQAPDPIIRNVCRRITRDEAGHIAFHADFFRSRFSGTAGWKPLLWRVQFRILFSLAREVVWWDHGRALRGCGIDRKRFFGKTRRACQSFLARVSHDPQMEKPKQEATHDILPTGHGV